MKTPGSYSTIDVKVVTNAKKREIIQEGSELKVKLTAAPIEGRANEELVDVLSSFFQVRRSDIRIIRGEKDRRKVVAIPIDGLTLESFFKTRK